MWTIISLAVGAIFGAGGAMALLRGVRKDLNGQGKRMRDEHTAAEFRALTVAVTTLALEEDRQIRQWLAEKFLDGWRRP